MLLGFPPPVALSHHFQKNTDLQLWNASAGKLWPETSLADSDSRGSCSPYLEVKYHHVSKHRRLMMISAERESLMQRRRCTEGHLAQLSTRCRNLHPEVPDRSSSASVWRGQALCALQPWFALHCHLGVLSSSILPLPLHDRLSGLQLCPARRILLVFFLFFF